MGIKIALISDSHGQHSKLIIPPCDILIHAGDWTSTGTFKQVEDFAKWLDAQLADEVVLCPGNHEVEFEKNLPQSLNWIKDHCPKAHILMESSVELFGIKFWGSAYTPSYGFGWSFNAGRDPIEAAHTFKPFIGDIWAKIPEDTNFLVTHGMPFGILDTALDWSQGMMQCAGDKELKRRIKDLKELKYVVGGHLHHDGGQTFVTPEVTYFNAAVLDDQYRLRNRNPIVINY